MPGAWSGRPSGAVPGDAVPPERHDAVAVDHRPLLGELPPVEPGHARVEEVGDRRPPLLAAPRRVDEHGVVGEALVGQHRPARLPRCTFSRSSTYLRYAARFLGPVAVHAHGPSTGSVRAENTPAPRMRWKKSGSYASLGRLPHGAVELLGVVADEDAPAIGADTVEDDRRRLGRARGREVAERLTLHLQQRADVLVGQRLRRAGRGARGPARIWPATSAVIVFGSRPCSRNEFNTTLVAMWPGMTTDTLQLRRVEAEVGDERLAEPLHRELGRAVRGVREAGPERRPEPVHAARVHDCPPSLASRSGRNARVQ